MWKRRTARNGFTLIELLVVVGIVALLVATLLPSLARVRQQAVATSCKARVRQLGMGMLMYLGQYGAYPAHQWRLNDPDNTRIRWFSVMARQLAGYEVQNCPATPDWKVGRNNAYGYNYKYLGSARVNHVGPKAPWESYPVKHVRATSRTIAFGERENPQRRQAGAVRLGQQPFLHLDAAFGRLELLLRRRARRVAPADRRIHRQPLLEHLRRRRPAARRPRRLQVPRRHLAVRRGTVVRDGYRHGRHGSFCAAGFYRHFFALQTGSPSQQKLSMRDMSTIWHTISGYAAPVSAPLDGKA